jgi:small multidrug resistance pump
VRIPFFWKMICRMPSVSELMKNHVYLWLAGAIAAEIAGTVFLKKTEHFTVPGWSIFCISAYAVCYWCFSAVLQEMNLGVAYALWSGIGLAATTLASYFLYHQELSHAGWVGLVLIGLGCILVNLKG